MRARAATPLELLLVVAAQLADLVTFGIAARLVGPSGEIGPLRSVYLNGGFGALTAAKLLALGAMLCVIALYARFVGRPRRLALLAAAAGIFGAATNVVGVVAAGWRV